MSDGQDGGQQVDYAALAKQAGATSSQPAQIDYAALAKQAGATSSQPGSQAGPTDPIAKKYGLPAGTDLTKAYFAQPQGLKIDPGTFSRAYAEANPQKQDVGFLQNLWGEAKNLFQGLTSTQGITGTASGVGVDWAQRTAQNPVSGIPVVGPMAVARTKQAKTDPWGALGAGITDVTALAAPFLIDRVLSRTPEAAPTFAAGEEAPAPAAGASMPRAAASVARTAPVVTTVPTAEGSSFAQRLGITDPPPNVLLTKAIKPMASNVGWDAAIQKAMPALKGAEADLGHPIGGVDDALEAAAIAKKQLWKKYETKLQSATTGFGEEETGAVIDGNEIADAMMNSVDKRTALQNPALVARIEKVANTYRHPMALDEAEDFLQSANNDLHSYYAKNKVGQQVAARDPETGYVVAEASALRNELYSKLDDLTGPGAADLKQQYGALTNVENELLRRKNVAARQNPQSLQEQLSMARAYGKIAVGVARLSPASLLEGTESLAASKWLKERNTTDAMISRAFENLGNPFAPAVPRAPGSFAVPAAGAAMIGGTPQLRSPASRTSTTIPLSDLLGGANQQQ